MRIRNSRPPFPLPPLPPVSRFNYHHSQGLQHINRFLVEEANRCLVWSCSPLRNPSSLDVKEGKLNGMLHSTISAGAKSLNHVEQKNGKENCMPGRPNPESRRLEETGNEGRKSKLCRAYKRERDRSNFSTHIVLALQAPSSRPEREFPLKKRKIYRHLKLDTKGARNEAKTDTIIMREKEVVNEDDDKQENNNINCVTNSKSSLPSQISDSVQGQEKDEEMILEETAIELVGVQRRRRGRPRKQIDNMPMGALDGGWLRTTDIPVTQQRVGASYTRMPF